MSEINYTPLIEDMVWSYSRIKSYEDCPYCWYLKYICEFTPRKDMFFSSYGSFIHKILAEFNNGELDQQGAYLKYLADFSDEVKGFAPSQSVLTKYYLNGLECLKHLQKSENKVLSVEEKALFRVEEYDFQGFLDCIEQKIDNKTLVLCDHKSRTLRPRSNRNKPTKSDEELDSYLRQLYLYSIYLHDKYGEYPEQLVFNCFRSGERIVEDFSEERLYDAIDWAVQRIEEIKCDSDFLPNIEWFRCKYLCDMNHKCEYYRFL